MEKPNLSPNINKRRGHLTKRKNKKKWLEQMPWRQPQYIDSPTEPLHEEDIESIHNAAMRIIEEVGIDFLNDEARNILQAAGCDVSSDTPTVRMDRGFVMEQIAKAPKMINIVPRNPDRSIILGETYAAFGIVGGPPNASDLDNGRRTGNRKDYQNFLKSLKYSSLLI